MQTCDHGRSIPMVLLSIFCATALGATLIASPVLAQAPPARPDWTQPQAQQTAPPQPGPPGQQLAPGQQRPPGDATAPRPLTAADYARAERFLAPALAAAGRRRQRRRRTGLPDERFWYRNQTADGFEFILVTPATRTREPAFDHARLAATLSAAAGGKYTATPAPLPVDRPVGRRNEASRSI